jgi:hypothetical protein
MANPLRVLGSVIAIVLATTSCQVAPTEISTETSSAAGFYGLVSVNDTLLPRIINADSAGRLEIVSDTIVLVADGRWADITHYRDTEGTSVTFLDQVIAGRFEVSNKTVFFQSNSNSFTGALDGGTLTINLGAKAVYKR